MPGSIVSSLIVNCFEEVLEESFCAETIEEFIIRKDMDKYFIDGENNYQTYYDYYYDYMPWRWHYADREYRDEKVAFFVTSCQSKWSFHT